MLGITRQRVQQLIGEPEFPPPDGLLKAGRDELKMWEPATVRKWAVRAGRSVDNA